MKTVCFFGLYNPQYSRNKVLITGFQQNNWQVAECRVDPHLYRGWKKYWQLVKVRGKVTGPIDLVIVAYPGQTVVWLARLLFWRQMIVFDAFTSLYDSNVFDRQLYPKNNWYAWRDWLLDWLALSLADKNLVDTNEHAKYFHQTFGIEIKKFIRVFVGSEIGTEIIHAISKLSDKFLVHFHGHYIPLQGIEYIIKAAKILNTNPEIKFRLVGTGQEYQNIQKLYSEIETSNIEFLSEVPFEQLASLIEESDIVLGIFGLTNKAQRVIPNKVFEGLSLGKPVVTADTPAIRELLTDQKNVLLCKAGDYSSLAEKIVFLEKNPTIAKEIASAGRELMKNQITPKKLVQKSLEDLLI
jgi:glycosyltransferase involved in cell wall biosynthesis